MTNLIIQLADYSLLRHRSRMPRLLIIVVATLRHGSRMSGLLVIDVATVRHGSGTPRLWPAERSSSLLRQGNARAIAGYSGGAGEVGCDIERRKVRMRLLLGR
ncbi:hypothetical protein B296_00010738 [Ensete ventricosum]|uniref:Uncharacterized protein n=1 Tax=Ensete ventricosum TaxID=4639 RepID=A0A427AFC0_ENSVE|nr:hypothetical protein B296_00010738 [Ensete ventricosum]